jgi:hypothetical protein
MLLTKLLTALRAGVLAGVVLAGVGAILPGCAPQVPPGTQLLASGHVVSGVAPDDGLAYVVDKESNELLYTGRVKKGDNVSVNPEQRVIQLNATTAEQRTLRLDHTFEVRFQRSP